MARDEEPAAAGFLQAGSPLRLSAVPDAWNALFSRGRSYEQVAAGSRFSPDHVAGYYLDFSSKTHDPVPASRLLPAAHAQLALGWWERHLAGDPDAVTRLVETCQALAERASRVHGDLLWIHRIAIPKYGLQPPFASALAQGQIASAFVRAHMATGDTAYEALAREAILPLLANRTTDLVTMTRYGPVLEEIPTRPRSHVLNGWVSALFGLLDVGQAFADDKAAQGFTDGYVCLAAVVDRYDVGWWTNYSLYPTAVRDLAKPVYHRVHIDQMRVLGDATGFPSFFDAARRWESYDTTLHRLRLAGQKAQFVARYSRGTLSVGAASELATP